MTEQIRCSNFKGTRALIILALTATLHLSAQQTTVSQSRDSDSVPHGTIHHHVYITAIGINLPLGQEDFYVYTPPGYDPKSSTKYPVLYLLHGDKQHSLWWQAEGNVRRILDASILAGKTRPMIVVMPSGYGDYRFFRGPEAKWLSVSKIDENVNLFSQMLLHEIIPLVESNYRVSSKRGDRAIAGLSMGGREAITIGLNNPRKFAWIGGFSAAFPDIEPVRVAPINPKISDLRLIWIACGTEDQYAIFKEDMRLAGLLRQQGLPVTTAPTPGRHDPAVWRSNLKEFVPLLFQPKV